MSKNRSPILCLITFLVIIMIISGCSSKASTVSINKQFTTDTTAVLELYSKRIKDGVQLTDQQLRQIDYYYNAYSSTKSDSDTEKQVFQEMITLKVSAEMYETAYKKQNRSDMTDYLKGFNEQKKKVEDNLK